MPALNSRQVAWHTLTTAPDDARAVAEASAERIRKLNDDRTLSDGYRQERITQERNETTARLAEIRQAASAARDTLLAAATELDKPTGDAAAQLLTETREARAWARVKPLLDTGRSHLELLGEAVASGDRATVRALAVELPAYLSARASDTRMPLDRLANGQPDMSQVRRALDVATARVFGDDQGHGTAARLRLHVAGQHPLAEARLEQVAVGRGNLRGAFAVKIAQHNADEIATQLAGDAPAGPAAGGE